MIQGRKIIYEKDVIFISYRLCLKLFFNDLIVETAEIVLLYPRFVEKVTGKAQFDFADIIQSY